MEANYELTRENRKENLTSAGIASSIFQGPAGKNFLSFFLSLAIEHHNLKHVKKYIEGCQ